MNQALDYLATLGADFKGKPVVRLLVGDSNLDKEEAEQATQGAIAPSAASGLQANQKLLRWEVHTTPGLADWRCFVLQWRLLDPCRGACWCVFSGLRYAQ